jgi:ATP-dependent protease ClpP protease subunit
MTKALALKAASKPFFRASITADGEFEILLYDEIGADWMGNGTTARSVRSSLDAAGACSKIVLRINSPGGDAFEGIAIGNVLKATGKPIDVYVDGLAASAASIVAMCGDTITMASNAMMMVHNAWTLCAGYASDMRKMGDTLDRISTSIAQTYVDKTGKPLDEIQALMDAESWLSAADCVESGFATAIAAANEPAIAMARGFKVLNLMKRVPESLQNNDFASMDGCQCYCQACLDDDCANCSNVECEDSNCADCPMQEHRADNSITPVTKDSLADEGVSDLKRARLALAERMQRRSNTLSR